jgi:serine/threonine protein kinase
LAEDFGELEILELIGRGGMGAVYKVRQKSLNRLAALKILPAQIADSPEFSERFEREAQALARLDHSHIVTIYDNGRRQGLFFFLMEYVDGSNLRQWMDLGRIAPEQALVIVPQICDALQYAHEHGIVHRDIKPENILVGLHGQVKIADFGIAKLVGPPSQNLTLTQNGIVGTTRYMAPEQIEHPGQVDHRADIFSLGFMFYEMLTGELPMGRFDPPSRKAQIDARFDKVVFRALERDRERRYQKASDVKTDIETITSTAPRSRSIFGNAMVVGTLASIIVAGSVLIFGLRSHQPASAGPNDGETVRNVPGPSPRIVSFTGTFFLSSDWSSIQSLERVNNVIYMGGVGADGHGRFGAFNASSAVFTNLSGLLPESYAAVKSLAFGDGHLLVGAATFRQQFWAQLGDFTPDDRSFRDQTGPLHAPFPYRWGLNAIAFDGDKFLIAGAGEATGIAFYSPSAQTLTPLARQIPYYFATNDIVLCGNSFLLVGAGVYRPGPATPPALGWMSFEGEFRDLRSVVPPELGTMSASAFNGSKVLIQGFSTSTGRQMVELFDPFANVFTNVSDTIPPSIILHHIGAVGDLFVLSGQENGKGYLATFDPTTKALATIPKALPADSVDVSALTDSAETVTVGGIDGNGRAFIDLIGPSAITSASHQP